MGNLRPLRAAFGPAVVGPDHASPAAAPTADAASLKILHVLRAPLGGLFRHVIDLVHGQAERGHRVGLIADSTTGGTRAAAVLEQLAPRLALGFVRVPISRQLGPGDLPALRSVARLIAALRPDVIHGHGAKGAALMRLAPGGRQAIRVYTPHGGSLSYGPGTLGGGFYRSMEWLLNWRTDLFLFESTYVADLFRAEVGRPRGMVRVVPNGVSEAEFEPIRTRPEAADLVLVGELRSVKAVDVLIAALAVLKQSGREVSATIAGDGPEAMRLRAQAESLGVSRQVHFIGHCPARDAFAQGKIFVVPSRAELLPYVVLEAVAAAMPVIATRVGGIPEIFGPLADRLIPPDDVTALVANITAAIDDPALMNRLAQEMRVRVRSEFSVNAMVEGGLEGYRQAIALRKLAQFA